MYSEQKTEIRNYLTGAGFLLIAALAIIPILTASESLTQPLLIVLSASLLVTGILLIIQKNRDLPAIVFLLTGMGYIFIGLTDRLSSQTLSIFILILALIILTAKDKSKYLYSLSLALFGIAGLAAAANPVPLQVLNGVLALYYAFACVSERIKLPGRALLTADNQTDFKASGSVLGYLLFGMASANWALVSFAGLSVTAATTLEALSGCMMILSGILLLTVGKMRFTPVMFILLGTTLNLPQFCEGSMFYCVSAMMFILGAFCILRKESRILPALMLFAYGLTAIVALLGFAASPTIASILDLVAAGIAVYIAFAVFSQRKLPLF